MNYVPRLVVKDRWMEATTLVFATYDEAQSYAVQWYLRSGGATGYGVAKTRKPVTARYDMTRRPLAYPLYPPADEEIRKRLTLLTGDDGITCNGHVAARMQAARVFWRVWRPIEDRMNEGAEADAGFDAGEWSGPAHARAMQCAYLRTLRRVAKRLHVRAKWLHTSVLAHAYSSQDHTP